MIAAEKKTSVKSFGIQDSVSFGIKQEGLAHIFNVLRNQLYSDKVLAVIREYSANATDANVEAGNGDSPIVVTLPNPLEPNFKVRDNGLGLSDNDIREIYALYGESTKRNSNALIGQLGLGSKSAFAYGDNFVINSFVNGTKNTYNAFIDDSQVGQIAKLVSEKTDEPNGVEIVIPVRREDANGFVAKAQSFFKYFKVKPIFKGATITFNDSKPEFSGETWQICAADRQDSLVAVMGGIAYPIDFSAMGVSSDHISGYQASTQYNGVVFRFNIGDLEVGASRENLQYTKRTIAAIDKKIELFKKEARSVALEMIDKAPTFFDAKKMHDSFHSFDGSFYSLRSVAANLTWKGVALTNDSSIGFSLNQGDQVAQYTTAYRGVNIKANPTNSISCSSKTVLVFNDAKIKSGIHNRLRDLVTNQKKRVYLITIADAHVKAFLDKTGLVTANFVNLSTIIPTKLPVSHVTVVRSAKCVSQEFIFNNNLAHYSCVRSNYWDAQAVDLKNGGGVYAEIHAFDYKLGDGNFRHPCGLNSLRSKLKAIGMTMPTVYGFKAKAAAEARKNKKFVTLHEYIAAELDKKIKAGGLNDSMFHIKVTRASRRDWWSLATLNGSNPSTDYLQSKSGLFGRTVNAINLYSDAQLQKAELHASVFLEINVEPKLTKPIDDIEALSSAVEARYPLLTALQYRWLDDKGSVTVARIIGYVNLIDRTSQQV